MSTTVQTEKAVESTTITAEKVIESVHDLLSKVNIPDRHSFFQIEKFIIGKEPTLQSKLWQILRELDARLDTFDAYQEQIEDGEDNLELIEIKISRIGIHLRTDSSEDSDIHALNMREKEINIQKLEREKKVLAKSLRKVKLKIKSLVEEMGFLIMGFNKIQEKTEGGLKAFDNSELQKELWGEKLLEEFNLRVLLGIPLDSEFVKTIMALHDDASVKQHVSAYLTQKQQAIIEEQKKVAPQEEENDG